MSCEEYGQRALRGLIKYTPYAQDMMSDPFADNEIDSIPIPYDAYKRLDELFTEVEKRGGNIAGMEEILRTGNYNGTPLVYEVYPHCNNLLGTGRRMERWKYIYRCMELAGVGPEILEKIILERLPYTHFSGSSGLLTTLEHGLLPRGPQAEKGITCAQGKYDANGGESRVYLLQWPSFYFMHYFYPPDEDEWDINTWGLLQNLTQEHLQKIITMQKGFGETEDSYRVIGLRSLLAKSIEMENASDPERSLFFRNFPVLYLVAGVETRVPRGSSIHAEVEVCGNGCVDPKSIRAVVAPQEHHNLVRHALMQTKRNDVAVFSLQHMKPVTNHRLANTRI